MKYLGIDWGLRKIGLAVGSEETHVAVPFGILEFKGKKEIGKEIQRIIDEENINEIILGQPLKLDSQEKFLDEFKTFQGILEALGLPVTLEDERFSTKASKSIDRQMGVSRGGEDDAVSAAVILQSYMDRS